MITAYMKKKNQHGPVSLLNCSPKAITGRAEAKKMYAVGASILKLVYTINPTPSLIQINVPFHIQLKHKIRIPHACTT